MEKLLIKLLEFLGDFLFSKKEKPSLNSVYIGKAQSLFDRSKTDEIYMPIDCKESHLYAIGATGTGKSTFLEHLIRQHIMLNEGFALIDVHGDLSDKIIKFAASIFQNKSQTEKKVMAKRLVVIEPFNLQKIIAFNPLEIQKDETSYSTVLELVEVFHGRWAEFWGPRTNELLRNVFEISCLNSLTLLEIPHILTNTHFRNSLVKNLQSDELKMWVQRYNKLSEPQKTIYRDPSLNKIGEFLGDTSVRFLMSQEKSSFNFREAIDKRKWIILNISKGKLKSNSSLLASLFLCKLQLAALSRVSISYQMRKPFYIYADEFQSLATQEVSAMDTILSESRKYKLFLRMSHQNLLQIEKKLLGAILGNVRVMTVFRINHADAVAMAQELNPGSKEYLTKKLTELGVGEAYFKTRGQPHRLAKLPLPPEPEVEDSVIEELRGLSLSFYARPYKEIEKEIRERHERLGLTGSGSRNGTDKKEEANDEW